MKRCPEFPNKKRYPTKKAAETTIVIQRCEFGIELRLYYCEACNGWHLAKNYYV
jgi:hypothetical protein